MRARLLLVLVLSLTDSLLSGGSEVLTSTVESTNDETATTSQENSKDSAAAVEDKVSDDTASSATESVGAESAPTTSEPSVSEEKKTEKSEGTETEKSEGTETEKSEGTETEKSEDTVTGDATEDATAEAATENEDQPVNETEIPPQSGPFIDLLGPMLLSLEMVDDQRAEIKGHLTNEALEGKKVVGLYFSADWCGPCRQFTPELVSFYNRMNSRRGKKDQFQIVWISRCRDANSYAQYFTQMPWLAISPEDASGQMGQMLSAKYKVKGIPTLVLLDEVGGVITTDARNKIPADKAGIGFPWRNPIASVYISLVPKSLRLMLKSHVNDLKKRIVMTVGSALGKKPAAA